MTRLKRYNREIVVHDDMVAAYLEQGYAVIDGQGNVIAEGKAMDYGSALRRIAELETRNRSLAAALEAANARMKELADTVLERDRAIALPRPAEDAPETPKAEAAEAVKGKKRAGSRWRPVFLTYEQYVEMGGALDEAAFNVNERRARAVINLATHNRVRDETPVRECVKNAAFDLIGVFAQEAELGGRALSGIASQSNDGVSVTYADQATVDRYWQRRKRELLAEHLADETVTLGGELVPLLYGGVEYDGGDAT